MMNKWFNFKTPIACLLSLSASSAVVAQGIERNDKEIWHPNPEQLESTVETAKLPVSYEDDGTLVLENDGQMTMDVELLAKESGISYKEAAAAIHA